MGVGGDGEGDGDGRDGFDKGKRVVPNTINNRFNSIFMINRILSSENYYSITTLQ